MNTARPMPAAASHFLKVWGGGIARQYGEATAGLQGRGLIRCPLPRRERVRVRGTIKGVGSYAEPYMTPSAKHGRWNCLDQRNLSRFLARRIRGPYTADSPGKKTGQVSCQ